MKYQVKTLFPRLSKYAIGDGDANSIDNSTRSGTRATTNGRGVAPLTLDVVTLLLENGGSVPRRIVVESGSVEAVRSIKDDSYWLQGHALVFMIRKLLERPQEVRIILFVLGGTVMELLMVLRVGWKGTCWRTDVRFPAAGGCLYCVQREVANSH
ncbi:hypothetical protein V6N13_146640 [Hibiscus sabdariffa]